MIGLFFSMISIASALQVPIPQMSQSVLSARQKIVEGKRKVAIKILTEAIGLEKSVVGIAEFKKERQRLAAVFMTSEGQRLFELAESIRFSTQLNYMAKYEEALKLEDGNIQILISQTVGWLRAKECAKAAASIQEASELNSELEEVIILQAYVQLCLEEPSLTREKLLALTVSKENIFKKILLAKKAKQDENKKDMLTAAREAIELDKNYPTAYYWAWSAIKDEENAGLDEAQSYLSLCRELTPQKRRKYASDPELCLEISNVEKFIHELENQ